MILRLFNDANALALAAAEQAAATMRRAIETVTIAGSLLRRVRLNSRFSTR